MSSPQSEVPTDPVISGRDPCEVGEDLWIALIQASQEAKGSDVIRNLQSTLLAHIACCEDCKAFSDELPGLTHWI
jgi:hypothetical protein